MQEKITSLPKRTIIITLAALLVGFFLFFAARVVFAKSHQTHYHANFGLFINGQRDKFDSFAFYEEVQACSTDESNNPRTRVHMHNHEFDTVHVHDTAVTWGNFFENLGYGLTDKAVVTNKGVYIDGQNGKQLTFILNGENVDTAANRVINSEDTLLISYGDPTTTAKQYEEISHSAGEHNHKPDPATCSGSSDLKFSDRLKQAIDFTR